MRRRSLEGPNHAPLIQGVESKVLNMCPECAGLGCRVSG